MTMIRASKEGSRVIIHERGGIGGSSAMPTSRASPPCTACSVGGTVSGLDADESVTLLDNGADELTVTGDGAFTFSTREAAGDGVYGTGTVFEIN